MSKSEYTANQQSFTCASKARPAFIQESELSELPPIEYTELSDLTALGYDIPLLTEVVE